MVSVSPQLYIGFDTHPLSSESKTEGSDTALRPEGGGHFPSLRKSSTIKNIPLKSNTITQWKGSQKSLDTCLTTESLTKL